MSMIDLQSLFKDVLQSPEQRQAEMQNQGFRQAELATRNLPAGAQALAPLFASMAQNQPRNSDMLQRGLGNLMGRDMRTSSERVQGMLSGADTTSSAGLESLIAETRKLGLGAQAGALEQMKMVQDAEEAAAKAAAAERQRIAQMDMLKFNLDAKRYGIERAKQMYEENKGNSELAMEQGRYATEVQSQQAKAARESTLLETQKQMIEGSNLPEGVRSMVAAAAASGAYLDSPEAIYKIAVGDDSDSVVSSNGYTWNMAAIGRGKDGVMASPAKPEGLAQTILSKIDPKDYTPESVSSALNAFNNAGTDADMNNSLSLLELNKDADGPTIQVVGGAAVDISAYKAWNAGGRQGPVDFWLVPPKSDGTNRYDQVLNTLDFGDYTEESVAAWLTAQDTATTQAAKQATVSLLKKRTVTGATSGSMQTAVLEAETKAGESFIAATEASQLSNRYRDMAATIPSGNTARATAVWRQVFGTQDERDAVRQTYQAIKITAAAAGMPPGQASDKDVERADAPFPDENASPEYIASFLDGMAKKSAMAAEYNLFTSSFINTNGGNATGLQNAWLAKKNEAGFKESVESKYGVSFNAPEGDGSGRAAARARAVKGRSQ